MILTTRFRFNYLSSGIHTKVDAQRIYRDVEVPAKGEVTLIYTKRTWKLSSRYDSI